MDKPLIVIPTYNEIESLPLVLAQLSEMEVLVVDDNSPDGTGEWAQQFADTHPWCQVLHRESKGGLAAAYLAGFNYALERGYRVVGQLDADGSHDPAEIGRLWARLHLPDQPAGVIGSRWVRGGRVMGWPLSRHLLSRLGNRYIRLALRMPIKDATAGFRLYRTSVLAEVLGELQMAGYGFQVEMTYRLVRRGYRLAEVPTTFRERRAGSSKMSAGIAIEQLVQVTRWAIQPRR